MGLVRRGNKLWVKYKNADGVWVSASSGFNIGQEKEAQALLAKIEAKVKDGVRHVTGPLTVSAYAERWLNDRKLRGVVSVCDDESRLKTHVLSAIGKLVLADVQRHHVRDLIRGLQMKIAEGKLAPRTVRSVYFVGRQMFDDAMTDELIDSSPWKLKRHEIPAPTDKDPNWRANAVFTRAEVEQLISDSRIPQERRVLHALLFLTASRFGEVAALRWRDLDSELKPLGRIVVARSYSLKLKREKDTKTKTVRKVPVHPVLGKILAEWKLSGWAAKFGRKPEPDDLVVPSENGTHRNARDNLESFRLVCRKLGLRERRQHDTKRTFVGIATDDGAHHDRLRWVTHGRKGGIMGLYDEPSWASLCEEVLKMKIQLRDTEVIRLPVAANGGGFGTVLGTAPNEGRNSRAMSQRKGSDPNGIRIRQDESGEIGSLPSEPIESGIPAIEGEGAHRAKPGVSGSDCTKCTKLDDLIAKALSALGSGDVEAVRLLLLEMREIGKRGGRD